MHLPLAAALLLLLETALVGPAAAQPRQAAGELLVKYREGISEAEIAGIHAASGARVLGLIEELGIYRLAVPARRSLGNEIQSYTNDPRCERVTPNYMGRGGDFFPNDTSFGSAWHLNNTGQTGGSTDADVDTVEGWDITRGDSSIVIAVLDTGIDSDHPEFLGRILAGFDFVNGDSDPEADHSHGPQVTGILAANADNLFGVAGIDHFAKILPVKVLNSVNLGTTFDLMNGITYAANEGSNVINMSLIDYPLGVGFLEDALQFAIDAGATLIACAGNGGIGDANLSGPGASPLTISVGWTTNTDARSGLSGTGSALDIVAPGSGIRTIAWNTPADLTTSFSGCSAATPVVSGIVSLLLATDPSLTHDEVRQILTLTADDQVGPSWEDTPGRDDFFGHGRVNMDRALRRDFGPPASMPTLAGGALVFLVLSLLAAGCLMLARGVRV